MITIHNLGFPRIGERRELKKALESYWKSEISSEELEAQAKELRADNWRRQACLSLVPVGDFSLYDHVLDMSQALGNIPRRFEGLVGDGVGRDAEGRDALRRNDLDCYFGMARGHSAQRPGTRGAELTGLTDLAACEMTKWFNTNYHYIVPEFTANDCYSLDPSRLLGQLAEARALGFSAKPVILGPLSYLACGKSKDGSPKLEVLPKILPLYRELLGLLAHGGAEWVQIDEPILCTELGRDWHAAFSQAYGELRGSGAKTLVASYFGALAENRELALSLPTDGLHIDALAGRAEAQALARAWPKDRVLSLGIINGRNIWKTDLNACLDWLEPLANELGQGLWLSPSCSLIHVPIDLAGEMGLDPELRSWMAFAAQKLEELSLLAQALDKGRASVCDQLAANRAALESRRNSPRVSRPEIRAALASLGPEQAKRRSPYAERRKSQSAWLKLPPFPTTTIGSFPQTAEIRKARGLFKSGRLGPSVYREAMKNEIARCVREQEALGLDVLVHGEAERNDMVEYFGEQLRGYAICQNAWVQSYGSRCVKPPIMYGDVSRPKPMTVEWIAYAQSLTDKPMKGMLTGPVTMLNWSFVRDDQPRAISSRQLALALRDEVLDLEGAGIRIIQIDEAAFREGLPLRRSQWKDYLDWAVESFGIMANAVADATQVHTHMCYSEFNDIIESVAAMDADVITIETSRSDMELLDVFDRYSYPNDIGPGVYDIHSPNIPSVKSMVDLMVKARQRIPAERLWVNPDCGLKTRQWAEARAALANMVRAAHILRADAC